MAALQECPAGELEAGVGLRARTTHLLPRFLSCHSSTPWGVFHVFLAWAGVERTQAGTAGSVRVRVSVSGCVWVCVHLQS